MYITQSGSGDVSSADIALNEFMHNYLKEHYLFKDEYNTLEVDCKNVSYDNFLSTYLLKMKQIQKMEEFPVHIL